MATEREIKESFSKSDITPRDVETITLADQRSRQHRVFEDMTVGDAREMSGRLGRQLRRLAEQSDALRQTRAALNSIIGREDD